VVNSRKAGVCAVCAGRSGRRRWATQLILSLPASCLVCCNVLADEPSPSCQLVAPYLVAVAPETPQREVGPEHYRNIQYFFRHYDSNTAYIIKYKIFNYQNTSFVFSDKECKIGCESIIIIIDNRGAVIKRILFLSHMVVQPDLRPWVQFPVLIFLDPDGDRLVSVTKEKRRGGMYVSELHDVQPGSSGLHAWSTAYRSCLLRGKFDFFETLPKRPQ